MRFRGSLPGGLAAAFLLLSTLAAADVIVLKSGRRIRATTVREQGGRVVYETENGELSIASSLVASIERGSSEGGTASSPRSAAPRTSEIPLPSLPAIPSRPSGETGAEVPAVNLLPNGDVDRAFLEQLILQMGNDEPGRSRVAGAFLAAIDHEMRRSRADAASALSQRAVTVLPLDPQLQLAHGILLLHRGQVQSAREWLTRARLAAPESALAWKFLGIAEYEADRTQEAIRSWRKSLSLATDDQVSAMLERAEREITAESRHLQTSSGHFNLRFEGGQVSSEFRQQILESLERMYQHLDRQLDAGMREAVVVILYTDQMFRDVTRAPSWAGAVNDGRLRVPIEGLTQVTEGLARVLMHELAHSFVFAKSRNRTPLWLNEGIAQMMEGSRLRATRGFAEQWIAGRRLPWRSIEQPFTDLEPRFVPFAYAQSLAAVETLAHHYGITDLARLLQRLGEGQSVPAAMQSVYRLDYNGLDQLITAYLRATP